MRVKEYRKKLVMIFWIMGAVLLLVGCNANQSANSNQISENNKNVKSDNNKNLTLLFSFTTSNLDPHNAGSWTTIRAGLTETLVRLDDQLQLQPWLVHSWKQQDPKTWIFTIRDGVHFHDGPILDAKAVKLSLERTLSLNKGLKTSLNIKSMDANGQTLTIYTHESNSILLSELVDPRTAIVNVEAERKMGTDAFNMSPVATGPFKVDKFIPDVELQLVRYDKYWAGPAKLKTAVFKMNSDANVRSLAFQSKEVDIVYHLPPENIESIRQIKGLRVESLPSLRTNYLYFNLKKPVLQDVRVRQAIDQMIDRESLVQHVMLGYAQPANGPFHPHLPFGKKEGDAKLPNPAEAKRLLAEAGWKPGSDGILAKDGTKLTFELITFKNRPELPLVAQVLQGDLAKLGIQVTIKNVEKIDAYLESNQDWDLALYSNLTAPRGDGQYFLNNAFHPDGSLNFNHFNHEPFNRLLHQLGMTSEKTKREELTRQMVKILDQELPEAFLFYPQIIVGVSDRVVGFNPGSEEIYMLTHTLDVK